MDSILPSFRLNLVFAPNHESAVHPKGSMQTAWIMPG